MYDVLLFLIKLALFVAAAVLAVLCMRAPVNDNTTNAQIASLQIVLGSVVLVVYLACAQILAAIREHRQYDALDDALDDEELVDLDLDSPGLAAGEPPEPPPPPPAAPKDGTGAARAAQRRAAAEAAAALDPVAAAHSSAYRFEDGGLIDCPPHAVVFRSIAVLREHIVLVHVTGFLVGPATRRPRSRAARAARAAPPALPR